MAQTVREGVDRQYNNLQDTVKELDSKLRALLHQHAKKDGAEQTSWLPEESGEEEDEIQWLTPKPKGSVQSALDYTKQLSERVFTAFQSVSQAITLLPHPLKGGASQAYNYAQELYTTLKAVKTHLILYEMAKIMVLQFFLGRYKIDPFLSVNCVFFPTPLSGQGTL